MWGQILTWGFIFLVGIVLILGHMRLHELNLRIEEKWVELQELQNTLGKQKKERQQEILEPEVYAEELGMYMPDPEEYIVVHVHRD